MSLNKVRVFINISLSLSFVDFGSKILVNNETASVWVHFDNRLEWHPIVNFLFQRRTSPNHNFEVLVR